MKLPIKICISKDGEIEINVNPVNESKVKAAASRASDKSAQDLELRLMTVDDNDESKTLELNMDILKYAERKLKSGDKKGLLEFLNKNKHRFNPDLKDWLRDAIKSKGK